jgi:hypothetical protein
VAILSVREGIATDIADTFRANKELLANLEFIKQLVDTNAATSAEANQKNQSMFDKITANQSIFQGDLREISTSMATNNSTLASIATSVTSITQTTADSVEAAVMGIKTLMVKEVGNITDTIARVEGNMALLRNLVTSVRTPQLDATTVPTGTGPTACSDDNGDPPGPPLGPAPLSLQDHVDILDGADGQPHTATRGQTSSPGCRPPQVSVHAMDATDGRTTPVGATHSNDVHAYEPPQAPSALRGQLKSPMEPTGHFGSGLSVNVSSRAPRPGMSYPTNESAVQHGGVASLAPAPATDIPDFELPTGHFGSGLGATESSQAAWAESARQRNSLAAQVSGAPQHMDSCTSPFLDAPVGNTIDNQQPMQDGHRQDGQESRPASSSQYQDSHGYDMASGYTRPYHTDEGLSGGCIFSPCHANRRRQAMVNKVSPLDIAGLGDKRYHGGGKGYNPLTIPIVHRCGYTEINSSDVIACHQDIIHIHTFVRGKWEDHYQNRGPQVDKILEKGIPTFPRLSSIDVESTVEFYGIFQKTLMIYLMPIMPFNCISIKMGYEALCPQGMGIPRYAAIAWVLFEILPRLLPKTHTRIS